MSTTELSEKQKLEQQWFRVEAELMRLKTKRVRKFIC